MRVAITGVGIVSALGQSASQTFGALLAGQRGVAPIELFDPGDVRSRVVGEVRGLRASDVAPRDLADDFSRTDAMAVVAAREAAGQARLPRGARLGVVLGGTTGGMFETESVLSSPERATLPAARAARLVSYPLSASLSRVAEALGGARICRSICSACSGGAIALVQAAAWLRRGEVDYVIAGGADALCRLTVLGFNSLGATDPEPCRPFDRARNGLNLGEGAAALLLERSETAAARDAEVLAWLDGFAVGAEAHHVTHPDPSGRPALRLLQRALERAGRTPEQIGYVNAHGTGTQQNDAMEARALLDLLGPAASRVWVSSSKAQLGHTLGASGAVEAAITVLALVHGKVPPTAGLVEPERAELRHALAAHTEPKLEAALSSSFGFGGMSCVLALAAADTAAPPAPAKATRLVVSGWARLEADAELDAQLDPERSRRFDRASAFGSVGAVRALGGHPASETGLVLGTAFGNVERTMAFLARAAQKGPRQVPPAEFPHLVPSAPAGNVSIYAGLSGPVFAVSDLAQSGEAALCAGAELLELGVAERVLVGAVAPRDTIVETVLRPLHEASTAAAQPRGEGAGLVLLEARSEARGADVLLLERRAGVLGPEGRLEALPSASAGPQRVLLAASSEELRRALAASSWASVPSVDLAAEHGYHEALGAVALAMACELLGDDIERVLVLSGTASGYQALLLGRAATGG